ncbi:MAG: serine hydrolase [Planctomycetes bacterium]|nr:serine hydrolase [Planctomycetota bacterium]
MLPRCHSLPLLALLCATPVTAQDLDGRLRPLIAAHRGQVAVAIKHLGNGMSFVHRADVPMPTASLIKFPVMIEAYRQAESGDLDLGSSVTLAETDKVPGSGVLTGAFSAGARFALRDAVRLMIAFSDNTATNLVLDRIGLRSTAATMERLGCPNTKLHAKVFRRDTSVFPERSAQFGLGSTTAAEMVRLLEKLHRGELVSAAASKAMLEHLSACRDRDKFPRLLPPGTKLAHKTGSVAAARCDAGILYVGDAAIALCVLTAGNQDRRWTDNAADRLCAEIAYTVYRHYAPATRSAGPATPLANGASGAAVEDLQRTLNARLTPSPGLSVDGDFGNATRDAVLRFQRERGLHATGTVDPATFKALGPLITDGPPVPAPDDVNRAQLPKVAADALDGTPFVSCRAWAIADARTGALLWEHQAARRLDIASTTKIMTAHLVFTLARHSPAVLDEVVTFSERADRTGGSTAGVRSGERLTVGELLYGLLLPSGNDAAVALAEHFGSRFEPPEDARDTTDPLPRFVAEMNRTARRLGMAQTTYRNPHGLTAKGHLSCARDLLRLAHAALEDERFRGYVRTRQRGCRLSGADGHQRDIVWRNTNQLLGIEGYEGVKTGTTRAAGACLVSSSARGSDRLLLVVLGASGSAARYADSRNLYRWAWRQRRIR